MLHRESNVTGKDMVKNQTTAMQQRSSQHRSTVASSILQMQKQYGNQFVGRYLTTMQRKRSDTSQQGPIQMIPGGITEYVQARERLNELLNPMGLVEYTQNDFQDLRDAGTISIEQLMSLIPQDAVDEWEPDGDRNQLGFSYDWETLAGDRWHVHGHEPDPGADPGSVGAQSWTVRIRFTPAAGGPPQWLYSQTTFNLNQAGVPIAGTGSEWGRDNNNARRAASHIPITGINI